jgi:hypothetical protein
MNTRWHNELKSILKRFLKEESSVHLVLSMYSALRSTARCISGRNDEDTRMGVAQALIDITYGLDTNPCMMAYRSQIWPVWRCAVQGLFDGNTYMDKSESATVQSVEIDYRMKAISCNVLIREVAMTVLLCEQGATGLLENSVAFRDALSELKDPDAHESRNN